MKIEFVNHAGFIVDFDGIRILSDPWLFGPAFNDGWDLICHYNYPLENFSNIQYIWFSHEHPDHFSTPSLKAIPKEYREKITILYQETKDKKVIKFCKGLGFQTRELPNHQIIPLSPRFMIQCGQRPFFDSWILYNLEGYKILNINDCIVDTQTVAREIKDKTGSIDTLLTQFSYAAWKGNKNDYELRKSSARSKLENIKNQIEILKPAQVIPFASFIYFSHIENKYNNDNINTVQQAAHWIESCGATPLILYPGDVWNVKEDWDNRSSLIKYAEEYNLEKKSYRQSVSIDFIKLKNYAEQYLQRIKKKNNRFLIFLLGKLPYFNFLRPLKIFLYDLGLKTEFSFNKGLLQIKENSSYHVKMHSDSLAYLFRFDWGFDTLTVNGRFETDLKGFERMTKTFSIGPLNNTGRDLKFSLLFDIKFVLFFMKALKKFILKLKQNKLLKETTEIQTT